MALSTESLKPGTPLATNLPRGVGLMLAGYLSTSCLDLTAKFLVDRVPLAELVWMRYLVHFVLVCLVFGRGQPVAALVRSRRPALQLVRSAALLTSTICAFAGLHYMQVADSSAIMFASPLIVVALSVPMLGEQVGWRRWAAVGVGFLGALVIVRPGAGGIGWPALFPLGSAVAISFYQLLSRRLAGIDSSATTNFYTALVGAGAASLAVPFLWQGPTLLEAALLTAAGLFGGIGHIAITIAYRHAAASVLAPFVYAQLLWAAIGGILLYDQWPSVTTIAGALLVMGAGLFVFLREQALARRAAADGAAGAS